MAIFLIAHHIDSAEKNEFKLIGKVYVGRSSACHFHFPHDDRMSGKHGSFQFGPNGEIIFKDLESRNGTLLNGKKINETVLLTTDELQLGKTIIKIDASRLTPEELEMIDSSSFTNVIGEDKTVVITESNLFSRPQFDKTSIDHSAELNQRWNKNIDFNQQSKKVPNKNSSNISNETLQIEIPKKKNS